MDEFVIGQVLKALQLSKFVPFKIIPIIYPLIEYIWDDRLSRTFRYSGKLIDPELTYWAPTIDQELLLVPEKVY